MEPLIVSARRVAALAAMAAIPVHVAAQDSCAALHAMSRASDAFASLRGELISDGRWRARYLPAGFKDCTVEERGGDSVVSCINDFTESTKPADLWGPFVAELKECIGSGWKVRRADQSGEDATVVVIYNDSLVELEARLEKQRASAAAAMGLATGAWQYRVLLTAFTSTNGARLPSLVTSDSTAFCFTLKALLAAAPSAFKGVKGSSLSGRSWQALQVLEGLKDCRVSELRSGMTFFTCEADFDSRSALAAAQRQLAADSVRCLGAAKWRLARRPKGGGVWSYSVAREEDGPSVSIRGDSDDGRFRLNFDVDPE